ncbi:MAG: hypothetical protein U0169_19365 [Polyangiaceae bacterium]
MARRLPTIARPPRIVAWMRFASLVLALAAMAEVGCKRRHVEVATAPEFPYPTCVDGGALPGPYVAFPFALGFVPDAGASGRVPSDLSVRGRLRLADPIVERGMIEKFEVRRDACLWTVSVRQEWSRQSTDVEAVFDETFTPIRVWKRMTIPGSSRPDGHGEIRRYEFRGPEVSIKAKRADGTEHLEVLKGAVPKAVIGPGRALLTMWMKRAKLAVGDKVREPVLDFREMVEVIQPVTLKREPDREEPSLGRRVRVYTIYGREPVFTDDDDVVLGDLAGLRPSETLTTPEPTPAPMFGVPDPVHTP